MIDFLTLQSLTIPEGAVTKITSGSNVLWEKNTDGLPSIYQQVEWIGNAVASGIKTYLDLGFAFDTKAKIEMTQYVQSSAIGTGYIFGSAENSGKLRCMLTSPNGSAGNLLFYGSTGSSYVSVQPTLTYNTYNEYTFILESGKLYAYNKTTNSEKTVTTQGTVTMTNKLYLFAQNYNGTARFAGTNRISAFKYYDKNDELICDLVPCYRKSDSVIGMYDLVRKTFLTNVSGDDTKVFEKGADVNV